MWRYYGARSHGWFPDFGELWRHRELLWIFAVRDLKVRYRQTLVGAAWALAQPLTTMAIFVTLFGLLGHRPASSEVPYGLLVLCGLLPWQLFSAILTQSSGSLVANQALIGKVYFPRLILPLATVVTALVDFAIAAVLLVGALGVWGVAPTWTALLAPAFVALAVLTGLVAGIWLSALNAMYRDVGFVVPFLVQVGFFISPVIYETSALIPPTWRPLFALNPMVGVLEGFRWALLGHGVPPLAPMLLSVLALAALLASGLAYFRRVERFLADRI